MQKTVLILLALCLVLAGCVPVPPQEAAPSKSADSDALLPDFTFYDLEGNPHTLSEFRGKPVVLNFWASWCGPCKSEMPDLQAAYEVYGDRVQFLIVDLTDGVSETVDTAASYIAGQGYTFPVFYDAAMEGAELFGVTSIPVTYFIDTRGNVMAYASGAMSAARLQQGIDLILPQE